jgi:hypothetical protein
MRSFSTSYQLPATSYKGDFVCSLLIHRFEVRWKVLMHP